MPQHNRRMLPALLRTFSWTALRRHPWRSTAAVAAVMLGVALGFAVHVINASALAEFSQAVRSVQGRPDLELRAARGALPESLYGLVAAQPQVELASPWLELSVRATTKTSDASQPGVALRLLGADMLLLPDMAPDLAPRLREGAERLDMLAPATVFLNPAAQQALGLLTITADTPPLTLRAGLATHSVRVAGTVAANGPPLAVMDIGAAQDLWGRAGQLTRLDLRLRPGHTREQLQAALTALPDWPEGVQFAEPQDALQRVDSLSRAYRVNLTVLALVALLVGALLVFSVVSLSVAQRTPAFGLLGVLGLRACEDMNRARAGVPEGPYSSLQGLAGAPPRLRLAPGSGPFWDPTRARFISSQALRLGETRCRHAAAARAQQRLRAWVPADRCAAGRAPRSGSPRPALRARNCRRPCAPQAARHKRPRPAPADAGAPHADAPRRR